MQHTRSSFAEISAAGAGLDPFAATLLVKGHISRDKLSALEQAALGGGRVSVRQLWEASELSANEFADETALHFGLQRVSRAELADALPLTDRFAQRYLRETQIYPFRDADRTGFLLATADPNDSDTLRAAELTLGGAVEMRVASFEDIEHALNQRLAAGDGVEPSARASLAEESVDSLRDLASGAPVVRAVNDLIEKALELRASDIHIETMRGGLVVRMRVDGLLQSVTAPRDAPPQALISRIKILSGLNIAERRLPQDGAARLHVKGADIDIRVATMPTQHGESAVLRLLPRDRGLLDIAKLGFSPRDEARLRSALKLPSGMIVISGPTGSGKTTTLATMLSALNSPHNKILTIEDPVEYEIAGINQSQVKPSIGLTFGAAMRAFMRHDPNIIMVGEIRDAETASIAIHAALTGHLVLTTLHAETAAAAAPRLIDLGVEGFLLRSTLRVSLAQRLVRILCERCRQKRALGPGDLESDPRFALCGFKPGDIVYEPVGCERCGGAGYRGRVGVFEAMEVSGEVRDLIGPGVDAHSLDRVATRAGMTTMLEDAVAKCRAGVTSVGEALRVTAVR